MLITYHIAKGHDSRNARITGITRNLPDQIPLTGAVWMPLLSTPPTSPSYNINSPDRTAEGLLYAINILGRALSLDTPQALKFIKDMWSKLCSHTIALLDSFVMSGNPATPLGRDYQVRLLISVIFLIMVPVRLGDNFSLREQTNIIRSHPEFLPYLFKVVFRLAEIRHPWFEYVSMRVARLEENELGDSQLRRAFPDIQRRYDIPGICVGFLSEELEKPNEEIDGYTIAALLGLMVFCIKYEPVTCNQFLSRNLIPYLCAISKRFTFLLGCCRRVEDTDIACQCIMLSNDFVWARRAEGFSWLSIALENDILHSIQDLPGIISTPGVYSDELPDAIEAFQRLVSGIMPFLIFRSVLNRVLPQMSHLKASQFLQNASSVRSLRALADAVKALDEEAWRMKLLMYQFDDSDTYALCCLNEKCPKRKSPGRKRVRYKRCSRCYYATYCSRKCQVKSWDSHKAFPGKSRPTKMRSGDKHPEQSWRSSTFVTGQ
ncbi:hypothetical protein VNI00_015806 [Paramarasmius palmivorus]|uniref:MYND-type domain-containing protein n=1 Tax=Paramarasmius palmivorus TaxID=297713 RepID=A0AAW0BHS4_9AGAR